MQALSDTATIPADVKDMILRFAKAALAAAWMKGKSYLAVYAVSMGMTSSIVDPDFFQDYLGQRAWTDHFPNSDFLETILNSSFDWTGIRQPYVVATENDALNGVSKLFGHLLVHGRASRVWQRSSPGEL